MNPSSKSNKSKSTTVSSTVNLSSNNHVLINCSTTNLTTNSDTSTLSDPVRMHTSTASASATAISTYDSDMALAMTASLADIAPNSAAAQRNQLILSLLSSQYEKTIVKIDGYGDCPPS